MNEIDAISKSIEEALTKTNGPYNHWEITFCCNEHSTWYTAKRDDTRFDRASLDELVKLCRILNGWDK